MRIQPEFSPCLRPCKHVHAGFDTGQADRAQSLPVSSLVDTAPLPVIDDRRATPGTCPWRLALEGRRLPTAHFSPQGDELFVVHDRVFAVGLPCLAHFTTTVG